MLDFLVLFRHSTVMLKNIHIEYQKNNLELLYKKLQEDQKCDRIQGLLLSFKGWSSFFIPFVFEVSTLWSVLSLYSRLVRFIFCGIVHLPLRSASRSVGYIYLP